MRRYAFRVRRYFIINAINWLFPKSGAIDIQYLEDLPYGGFLLFMEKL